jgi:hypothetical protein
MVARRPFLRRSPTLSSTQSATRATIKALPSALHPPSPLQTLMGFSFGLCLLGDPCGVPRLGDDEGRAWGAMKGPLRSTYPSTSQRNAE